MLLKEIRLARGYSVPELSRSSGLSRRTIQDIEKRDACTMENLIRLSVALDASLDELCRDHIEKIRRELEN